MQLTAMIKDIRKHINGDFNASQLLKQLDNVQKPFSADHWRFSSPAVMLGLALLLAVIAAIIWKKCCAQIPSTAPTPAIAAQLLAPPPQINIQPAPQPQMPLPQPNPPAYTQQNPTFNFSKPTAPVLIYT